ncbi:MAG: outer membrane beta-barrel protein [Candidatus Zixiibacteriota bacterium]
MKKALILSILLLCSTVIAGDNISFAVKGGMVDNFSYPGFNLPQNNLDQKGLVGGQFFLKSPKYVDIILSMDYSWENKTYQIDGQSFDLKTKDLSVSASLVYPVTIASLRFYGGGGVGTHSYSHEYYRPRSLSLEANNVTIPEVATYLGYHGIAGVQIPLLSLPGGLFVEGRYGRVALPDEDISYNNWTGGIFVNLP